MKHTHIIHWKKSGARLSLLVVMAFGIALLATALPAFASHCPGKSIHLQVPLPGTGSCVSGFPQYLMQFYRLFVGSMGLIATVMIMFGGFQWILAAGNTSKIDEAKSTIFSAIAGLLIALGSFTILNFLNPRLVELTVPQVPEVSRRVIVGQECPNDPGLVCGTYYKKQEDGRFTEIQNPDPKDLKNNADTTCRGILCEIPGETIVSPDTYSLTSSEGYVGGCMPKNIREFELGDTFGCRVIKCPAKTEKAKIDKGCKYYNDDDIVVKDDFNLPNKATRIQACNEDYCKLGGEKGCAQFGIFGNELSTEQIARIENGGTAWLDSCDSR